MEQVKITVGSSIFTGKRVPTHIFSGSKLRELCKPATSHIDDVVMYAHNKATETIILQELINKKLKEYNDQNPDMYPHDIIKALLTLYLIDYCEEDEDSLNIVADIHYKKKTNNDESDKSEDNGYCPECSLKYSLANYSVGYGDVVEFVKTNKSAVLRDVNIFIQDNNLVFRDDTGDVSDILTSRDYIIDNIVVTDIILNRQKSIFCDMDKFRNNQNKEHFIILYSDKILTDIGVYRFSETDIARMIDISSGYTVGEKLFVIKSTDNAVFYTIVGVHSSIIAKSKVSPLDGIPAGLTLSQHTGFNSVIHVKTYNRSQLYVQHRNERNWIKDMEYDEMNERIILKTV